MTIYADDAKYRSFASGDLGQCTQSFWLGLTRAIWQINAPQGCHNTGRQWGSLESSPAGNMVGQPKRQLWGNCRACLITPRCWLIGHWWGLMSKGEAGRDEGLVCQTACAMSRATGNGRGRGRGRATGTSCRYQLETSWQFKWSPIAILSDGQIRCANVWATVIDNNTRVV